jgi:hypothetical protein
MLVLGAELAQRLSFYRASGIKYPQFFLSMELRVKRAPRIDIEITVPGIKVSRIVQ